VSTVSTPATVAATTRSVGPLRDRRRMGLMAQTFV
jgi:hypothetical protein